VQNRFSVVTPAAVWQRGDPGLVGLLASERLYKSLSLLLACDAGVDIPPSLLLQSVKRAPIAKFAEEWGYPLMIRMDYRSRPNAKPLGGLPLYGLDTMQRVCEDLVSQGYAPLFHPHLDRFKDMFSCGVLLTRGDFEADVEVVGRGFDASDLRLGKAIPHESFGLNLAAGNIERHTVIADEVYQRQRAARAKVVHKLKAYSNYVNRSGVLLSDLDQFDAESGETDDSKLLIPPHYEAMPNQLLQKLLEIIGILKSDVIAFLPNSEVYVASLSYLPVEGWVLWDVYGDWYQR
jgi:hypothetical protein